MTDLTELEQKLKKYGWLDTVELNLGAKGKLSIPKILLDPEAGKRQFINQLREEGLSSEQIDDLINKGLTMTQAEEWKKNRAKWVAALRDPSRKQVAGRLGHQSTGGQCCMGVLAEIAGCTHEYYEKTNDELWDGDRQCAPWRAMEFVGLTKQVGSYLMYRSLLRDNDSGKTFAEIADIIEREPEGLFRDRP